MNYGNNSQQVQYEGRVEDRHTTDLRFNVTQRHEKKNPLSLGLFILTLHTELLLQMNTNNLGEKSVSGME